MTIKIDDRAIKSYIRGLKNIITADMLDTIGRTVQTRVVRTFLNETDPYGQRWQPLKRPRRRQGRASRTDKVLSDTDTLRRSINYVINVAQKNVRIGAGMTYVRHQHGTLRRNLVARRFMPIINNTAALPASWQRAIQQAAERSLKNKVIPK
ncbi:phage virion morphogenesis protein [Candidatus Persebacteraceae bacterium Df01]|jgi:phage gpG-like protein|uniref:Phage virion morphogenesis protein n=1 Tax=Candidatus Doriopsillibacter californiensis TaxID=2970740 RepID=A0ABT7QMC1_9GAMM|nr:phage virion morphogenesis protein [Candidatus Persebacteraceae bacterium Df01]